MNSVAAIDFQTFVEQCCEVSNNVSSLVGYIHQTELSRQALYGNSYTMPYSHIQELYTLVFKILEQKKVKTAKL